MKKIISLIIIILVLTGCATIGDVLQGMTGSISKNEVTSEETSKETSEEMPEKTTEETTGGKRDNDTNEAAFGSLFLSPQLEFTLFYSSYYLLGGYGFGDDNFREGEGIRWSISNNQNNEIIITRALLKNLSDGSSWWYFKTSVDEEEYIYEMNIKNNYDIVKVRYKDKRSGKIGEFIPEQGDSTSESDEDIQTLYAEAYDQYAVGEVSVKTKAGSFKAEHLLIEDINTQFKYEYWVADKVPGHMVKYIINNLQENEKISGELIDIRGGYKTELNSY